MLTSWFVGERWLRIGALALVLIGAMLSASYWLHADFADSASYTAAVQRSLAGGSPYTALQTAPYPLPDVAHGRGFIYPPSAILLLLPFAAGSGWVWNGLMLATLAAALWVVGRGALLVAVVLASPLVAEAMQVGQITPLIAVGILVAWRWPRGTAWVAGAGALLKLFPVLLLVWAIRKRQPILMPLAVGALTLAGSFIWPGHWVDFLAAWRNGQPACWSSEVPSFACLGIGWLGPVVAIALTVAAWRVRADAAAFALLGWAMIAPSPDLWMNYLLIPLVSSLPLLAEVLAAQRVHVSPSRREGGPRVERATAGLEDEQLNVVAS